MKPTRSLAFLGKLLICAMAFNAGLAVNGMLLPSVLGLQPSALPEGVDQGTLGAYLVFSSLFLVAALAILARGLGVGLFSRALVLALLTWIAMGVNTALEASIFTAAPQFATGGMAFTAAIYLLPGILGGLAVAFFFPPSQTLGRAPGPPAFFRSRMAVEWAGRLGAVFLAFPLIYIGFGMLVAPVVMDAYAQGEFGLTLPGWAQIIPILFLRSFLFLLVCVPVALAWRKSRLALAGSLGLALFVLVGLAPLTAAYWLPLSLRLVHGAEILAGSFVYAAALALLLSRGRCRAELVAGRAEVA